MIHAGGPYAGAVDARVSARGQARVAGLHQHARAHDGQRRRLDARRHGEERPPHVELPRVRRAAQGQDDAAAAGCRRRAAHVRVPPRAKGGSTTIIDVGGLRGDWEGYAQLVDDLGVRVYASPPFRDRNTFTDERGASTTTRTRRPGATAQRWRSPSSSAYDGTAQGRLRGMLNASQVETCSEPLLKAGKAAARDLGVPIHTHAGGNLIEFQRIMEEYRNTPIQFLADIGFLDERTLIGHGVFTTAHPVDALSVRRRPCARSRETGATVGHCPYKYGKMAMTLHSFQRYLDAGRQGRHGHRHLPDGHGGGAALGVDPRQRHRRQLPGRPVARRLQRGDHRRLPLHRPRRPRTPGAREQGGHPADRARPHGHRRLHGPDQGAGRRGHRPRRGHGDRRRRDAGGGRPRDARRRGRVYEGARRPPSATGSTCRAGTGTAAASISWCRPRSRSTGRRGDRPRRVRPRARPGR